MSILVLGIQPDSLGAYAGTGNVTTLMWHLHVKLGTKLVGTPQRITLQHMHDAAHEAGTTTGW